MLDHLSLGVLELRRSIHFYDAALEPLGYRRLWTKEDAAGYGKEGSEEPLALKQRAGAAPPGAGFHLALTSPSRAAVDGFWQRATSAGGRDDGPPGLRPRYGPNYYAAFVIDPDGYRLEAVCHAT